jgi:hypothetical protein
LSEAQVEKIGETSQALKLEIESWSRKQQGRAHELRMQGFNSQALEKVRTTKTGVDVGFFAATFAMDRVKAKEKGKRG